jgi:PII-like signaling protein
MPIAQPARLLEIHIAEDHQHSGKPLYEVLVGKCRELGVAGVTVFRGFEGYGETATMHRKHLLTNDQPVIVMIIDSEENIARVLPSLEELADRAMITVSQVTMKRVQNTRADDVP